MNEHKIKHHKKEMEFKCSKCDYKANLRILLRHKIQEHKKEVFQCDQCNFTATTDGMMKTHKQVHSFMDTTVERVNDNNDGFEDFNLNDDDNEKSDNNDENLIINKKKKTKKEYLEKEIKSKAIDHSNKVNLKSFKDKYLTLKKKTSAIHKEHGTDSDYILIIKNNLQKPGKELFPNSRNIFSYGKGINETAVPWKWYQI